MAWDRLLWGIQFSSQGEKPLLIGTLWLHPMATPQYFDEPPRPLLFKTRVSARNWCRERLLEYKGRNDCCAKWKFKPVRVRETVKPI
jgi:hypothetical protein